MKHLRYLLSLSLLLLMQNSWAGRDCEPHVISADNFYQAHVIATAVYHHINQSTADVVMIARVGSDVSKYGMKYTHAGFALRHHPQGQWLFIHVLNQCSTAYSALYDEGLVNFFLDDPFQLDALIVTPSPQLQQKLLQRLSSPSRFVLHQRYYSVLAYPFSPRYQNSNGWILEMLASAQMPVAPTHRAGVQRFLINQGYTGDRIRVSPLKRVGASLFKANVQFDDHPEATTFSHRYEIVSVASIVRYLQQTDNSTVKEIRYDNLVK